MNESIKSLVESVGAMAEMSLTFYRAAIDAGADKAEAKVLMDSFMRTVIFGGNRREGAQE